MVTSLTGFSDIQNHWARLFIEGLVQRGIVSGFPDKTFRPNQAMTRAEFAAIVVKAFPIPGKRKYVPFVDVGSNYWAAAAIKKAYETEFLSGYPDGRFRPEDKITRVQALISLVSGLGITTTVNLNAELPKIYQDANFIPSYARDKIAIATSADMVVNYPTLQMLRPLEFATRGEVATFIYQALVYLKQVTPIPSKYIVTLRKTVSVSHRREFRGVWVTTGWNIDWPSKQALSVAQQKAELIAILDLIQALNFNALILQVRVEGDAFYYSKLEPWSAWLTGIQGKAPEPFYDPLEFVITESHKRNIELHAWFNPYRVRTSTSPSPNVAPHITVTHPEVVCKYGNELWVDPGIAIVRDWTYNVILDVVRRYDVDGIQIDDYWYPYPIAGQTFPDGNSYAAYQKSGGQLSLGDWRRENTNQMVRRLADGIHAEKPYVKFGIAPFGIYRPGQPAQIRGLDAYNELYSDSKKWLEQGWVDYLSPQLYWRIDPPAQSYPVLLKWWTENNPKGKHIYTGNKLGLLDGKSWTVAEITRQVEISRSLSDRLSLGNVFYSMKDLLQNRLGIADALKKSIYAQPALVPIMQWIDAAPPTVPTGAIVKDGKLNWNATNNADIRSWTLYQQNGSTWTLLKVFSAATNVAAVEPGTYALCAVDRMGNESAGVVISF
ncbi:family 10 glycosylhydrolase [Planktothrix sp. FACHB-1355]|uniref:Family 10 glycosylhydrolase n=1 Tax=Aerosakkonema funiforme FACHB-1375 TaxID=2949571 RepID=A0A926VAQ1_9CYAN|nr:MULTISPECIES: family 10 glycosylhydrolase [Oscillatoriales]MBD2179898.1 family 10 glycosylhydrolase [Aerosakkonema funiforme FACHB-1375]MBD3562414.1 family 10 glycosylhydrolase [Planktothrix sp. FACHB-1355]